PDRGDRGPEESARRRVTVRNARDLAATAMSSSVSAVSRLSLRVLRTLCASASRRQREALIDRDLTAGRTLGHLDARWEAVFQLVDVRDHEDAREVVLDCLDRFEEAVAPFLVLRAEAFVHEQRLQPGAGAARQQPG